MAGEKKLHNFSKLLAKSDLRFHQTPKVEGIQPPVVYKTSSERCGPIKGGGEGFVVVLCSLYALLGQ